ncbi:MAG: hypothetical protein U1B79_01760 [Candidatus Pacearchaeota archaeon]|nr:hypothetical protein [Candidatus Pacearchaeota archaeon]MDZ4226813.1 hypothetical protein [Candidatus Pacearchaeota archaeon]
MEEKNKMEEKVELGVNEKNEEKKTETLKVEESENKNQEIQKTEEIREKEEIKEKGKEEIKEKKTEKKKGKEEKKVKKELAVARGLGMHLSKKHGMYICSFIKNKKIDDAIADLEKVKLYKKAVPFKGEIPHRKGRGMMSGRYPIKGAGFFINLLKVLKGNSVVNGLDIDRTIINTASSSWGSRPAKSGGRRAKRINVILEAREKMEIQKTT